MKAETEQQPIGTISHTLKQEVTAICVIYRGYDRSEKTQIQFQFLVIVPHLHLSNINILMAQSRCKYLLPHL